jgi:hypothetical protein
MRSHPSSSPARRARREAERRSRRRPALVVGGLALAALATAGMTGAATVSPASAGGSAPVFSLASAITPAPASSAAATASTASDETTAALAAAQGTLDAAAAVTTDIQSAGLDLGEPDTSVDTAALSAAADRLRALDGALAPFAAGAADDLAAATAPVDERISHLRGALEGAQQRKAEEEAAAAERARQEAEAAAAASAARPAAAPSAPVATGGNVVPQGDAQAIAAGMLANYGWGSDQMGCLVPLWQKESGWNVYASNSSSGAYGIPQALPGSKMASAGADWQTNAATQIAWGLGYISGRYGSPCGAWSHSQSVGWY